MHGGVSGFPKRCESPYDTFGVGHSSTSISAALGMALAAKHKGEDRKAIAIIGDGAMSAGMAFEALNNAGVADADMLVILNDNEMSISPPVGALNNILTRLTVGQDLQRRPRSRPPHARLRPAAARTGPPRRGARQGHDRPGTLFEEFGFHYYGPIDGHDLDALIPTLENLKKLKGPKFLHVITKKGQGYKLAEADPILYHGVGKFAACDGIQSGKGRRQADLHAGFRRLAVRHGQGRFPAGRHHPGHARRLRHGALRQANTPTATTMSASPSSTP
jgi:1-deoxy-D-xylulose-5-phosphate synthase